MQTQRTADGHVLATLSVDEVMTAIRTAVCAEAGVSPETTISRDFFALHPGDDGRVTHFTLIVERRAPVDI
jgi:hypothetical protein